MKFSRKYLCIFMMLIFIFGNCFSFNALSSKDISDGIYTIESMSENQKCLDIDNASTNNYAKLQLYTCNQTDAQKFYIHKCKDNYFEIKSICSGKMLNAEYNNNSVYQFNRNNSEAQKWSFKYAGENCFYITSKLNEMAMSSEHLQNNNRAKICLKKLNYNNSQKFRFQPIKIFNTSEYTVSTDKSKLQMDQLEKLFKHLGSTKNWSTDKIKNAIQNSSMCFGAYNKQNVLVGFLRVVTDFESSCLMLNVVVNEHYRGKGIGTFLMRSALENEKLKKCTFCLIPSSEKVAKGYRLLGFKNTGYNYMTASSLY